MNMATIKMICHRCGSEQVEEQITDLPFKLDIHKILIVKHTPAFVCESCGEIMLSDSVMESIDAIIRKIEKTDYELEVMRFAA
jgi:YgiT-type zinc finger domain-containing protein